MDIFLDLQYGNFKIGSFNRLLNISYKYINQECVHTVNQSYKNYKTPPNLNIKKRLNTHVVDDVNLKLLLYD